MEAAAKPVVKYRIDVDYVNRTGRSFRSLVAQRMCPASRGRLSEMREERVPILDPATKRVVFDMQVVPISPFPLIRECCSLDRNYLSQDLPILEAVFRVFLMHNNAPHSIAEIRNHLEDWPGYSQRMRQIGDEALAAMIARDRFYGLRVVDTASLNS